MRTLTILTLALTLALGSVASGFAGWNGNKYDPDYYTVKNLRTDEMVRFDTETEARTYLAGQETGNQVWNVSGWTTHRKDESKLVLCGGWWSLGEDDANLLQAWVEKNQEELSNVNPGCAWRLTQESYIHFAIAFDKGFEGSYADFHNLSD
jgi:hypothetical protein